MKIVSKDLLEKYNEKPIVVALGFFDSLHKGHLKLVKEVLELSKNLNAEPAIFTFKGNPHKYINKSKRLEFFTFRERLRRYQNQGIKLSISLVPTKKTMQIAPEDFLNLLISNYNVKAIVTGDDFRYGNKASGDSVSLKKFALEHNIHYSCISLFKDENKIKYSTSNIEKLLQEGKVDEVNNIISENYTVSGKVVKGRREGFNNGVPTANIKIKNRTVLIAEGVYKTYTVVGKNKYLSITNVGMHPTFNDENFNIENHILDFKKDLYDKYIRIEFIKKIRDVIKFQTVDDLYKQIDFDIRKVRENND